MKRYDNKSHCTVNFALEAVGDPWTLLIVRDIAFDGKYTFKEFLNSSEHISSNILTNRLAKLESDGIILKQISSADRRASLYSLTEKGIDLIPTLLVLSQWSFKYDAETEASEVFANAYRLDPIKVTKLIQDGVRQGRAAFVGSNSIIADLISRPTR